MHLGGIKAHGRAFGQARSPHFDLSEMLFVILQVVGQGLQQQFGVIRRHHHPALHLGLGHVGHDMREVDDDLVIIVMNDREVAVSGLQVFGCFDLNLSGFSGV